MGRLLALVLAIAGLACPAHRQQPGEAEGRGAPPTWLFYTAGERLVAVWPEDPGTQVVLEPAPDKVVDPDLVLVGRYEKSTGRFTDVSTQAVVYFHDDGAGVRTIRMASAVGPAPPVPRQVSRLAVPSEEVCELTFLADRSRPEDSLIVVDTVPRGGACRGSDDVWFLVRLSMDASAEPLRMPSFGGAIAFHSGRGTIGRIGWLPDTGEAAEGSTTAALLRFLEPSAPLAPPRTAVLLFDDVVEGGDRLWFTLHGRLKFIAGPEGMRDPGGMPTPISRTDHAADGRYLYFVDGASIRRVRRDGSRAAELVCTFPQGQEPENLRMSPGRLLFETGGPDGRWLWSVPKGGGAATSIAHARQALHVTVSERWVFTLADGEVRAVREDGSDATTLATGIDDVLAVASGSDAVVGPSVFTPARGIVLVEKSAPGSPSVLRLRAVNPATRDLLGLGALPAGYASLRLLRDASGTATLLTAEDSGRKADVFLLDTAVPGSLRQLTRTPAVNEELVGSVDCGSGASSAWALCGLALAALFRVHGPGRGSTPARSRRSPRERSPAP